MNMKIYILLLVLCFFNSCDTQGVKNNRDQEKEVATKDETVIEVDSNRSILDDVSKALCEREEIVFIKASDRAVCFHMIQCLLKYQVRGNR